MSGNETLPGAPPDEPAGTRPGGGDCPDCGGTGKVGDEWCVTCSSTGALRGTKAS